MCVCGGGGGGVEGGVDGVGWDEGYAASQTTLLHIKILDKTDFPTFVLSCALCFQDNHLYFNFTENNPKQWYVLLGSFRGMFRETRQWRTEKNSEGDLLWVIYLFIYLNNV